MHMTAAVKTPSGMRISSDVKIGPVKLGPDGIYLLLASLYFGLCIYFYLFNSFGFENSGRDTWHHVAVLHELMASPFDPSNPHIPTDEPSRYFSPLNVVAALFGRLFGLDAFTLFGFMGALTCVGLVVACRDFALRYFKSPWAPSIFLTLLLFGWGSQKGFAGYHNFASFLSSAAYPALQTLILSIFGWSLTLSILELETALEMQMFRGQVNKPHPRYPSELHQIRSVHRFQDQIAAQLASTCRISSCRHRQTG